MGIAGEAINDMEMDDLTTAGLIGLGVFLLVKLLGAPKITPFGPSEVVTSTITYPPDYDPERYVTAL